MSAARTSFVFALTFAFAPAARADVSTPVAAQPRAGDRAREVRCRGHHCILTRAFFERLFSDTTQLATSARIVPSLTDGKPDGFKLYAVRPGSLFAQLLLENGDRLQRLAGFDLSTPDSALRAYTTLHGSDRFTLELERRGHAVTMEYEVQ